MVFAVEDHLRRADAGLLSCLVYAITKWLEGSRYGYYLFAVRDDEDAASAAGVNPLLVRTGAMCLSAFLTGIGGSLFAQYFLYLDPTHVISPELSFQFALLPALGGLGTAIGPGARLVRDHAAVGAAALLFRRRRRGPASRDLRRRARSS